MTCYSDSLGLFLFQDARYKKKIQLMFTYKSTNILWTDQKDKQQHEAPAHAKTKTHLDYTV